MVERLFDESVNAPENEQEMTTSSWLFGISLFASCYGRNEFANDICKIFPNRSVCFP